MGYSRASLYIFNTHSYIRVNSIVRNVVPVLTYAQNNGAMHGLVFSRAVDIGGYEHVP